MDVKIRGVKFPRELTPNKAGDTIIAYFDCEYAGLWFSGCALVKSDKGGFKSWLPKIEGPGGPRRAVEIVDNALRHQFMDAARTAYRAIGGTEAEWTPREEAGCDERGMPRDPAHPWNREAAS